ncbi:capsid cement protein [Methylocystis sp. S23]
MGYVNHVTLSDTRKASGVVVQNRFVKFDGAQAGAGDLVHGVAAYDAADGQLYASNMTGLLSVEAGAPVNAGQRVKSDLQGRAIPALDTDDAVAIADSTVAGAGYALKIVRLSITLRAIA